jgi:hypothetical protein
MVKKARDGDQLRVRGRCPGGVVVDADISITGVGERRAVIDGLGRRGAIRVRIHHTVTLRRLVLMGGRACSGAGLYNNGTTTMINSIVRDNVAGAAAGIDNWEDGALRLVRSIVRDNTSRVVGGCAGDGGGIANNGVMSIVDSTVTNNIVRATPWGDRANGGGIANYGFLRLERTVLRDNAARSGGGIENVIEMELIESVVNRNRATYRGGGIHGMEARTVLRDTKVVGNTASRGGGIANDGRSEMELQGSTVTTNRARIHGGGIWNAVNVTLMLDTTSTVTGNTPNDCVGTPAC